MGLIDKAIGAAADATIGARKIVAIEGVPEFAIDFDTLRAKGVYTEAAREDAQAFELRAIKRRLLRRLGFMRRA
ncbi:MAG TPA: hypothetical protein PKM48_08640, partial [Parvularculaceae bacterium]|nr:hypothetical protein [Parvularculaceae bacterium]